MPNAEGNTQYANNNQFVGLHSSNVHNLALGSVLPLGGTGEVMRQALMVLMVGLLVMGLALAQGPGRGFGRQGGPPMGMMMGGGLIFKAAQFLGVMPPELFVLSGGEKSLAQIAKDLGADGAKLEAALVEERNRQIDQAVTAKRLSEEQAKTYKASSAAVVKALVNQPLRFPARLRGR
jgi:hypothetical protein